MRQGMYLLTLSLLCGCASMSKQECLNADWQLIGFEDGSAGRAITSVAAHRKACAKVNITPDLARYESGHAKGAALYCTAENGFSLGNGGGTYNGVCADSAERRFLAAYNVGHSRFVARSEVEDLSQQLDRHQDRIEAITTDIGFHEREIIDADSTPEERAEHLSIIKELQQEQEELTVAVEVAEHDLHQMQYRLNELIRKQQAKGYR